MCRLINARAAAKGVNSYTPYLYINRTGSCFFHTEYASSRARSDIEFDEKKKTTKIEEKKENRPPTDAAMQIAGTKCSPSHLHYGRSCGRLLYNIHRTKTNGEVK